MFQFVSTSVLLHECLYFLSLMSICTCVLSCSIPACPVPFCFFFYHLSCIHIFFWTEFRDLVASVNFHQANSTCFVESCEPLSLSSLLTFMGACGERSNSCDLLRNCFQTVGRSTACFLFLFLLMQHLHLRFQVKLQKE